MPAVILDGKAIAKQIRDELALEIAEFIQSKEYESAKAEPIDLHLLLTLHPEFLGAQPVPFLTCRCAVFHRSFSALLIDSGAYDRT